jgi:hypothetical protein
MFMRWSLSLISLHFSSLWPNALKMSGTADIGNLYISQIF